MKFPCRMTRDSSGRWTARYNRSDLGTPFQVSGQTREEAEQKMQRELAYRLELCPCTGETWKDVTIELVDE